MEAAGGFHPPGDDYAERRKRQAEAECGEKDDAEPRKGERYADQRHEQQEERRLEDRKGRPAERIPQHEARARDRRHQCALKKSAASLLDDRDCGEDGGEQYDQSKNPWEEELEEPAVGARLRRQPERALEAEAKQEPESQRLQQCPDQPASITSKLDEFALPESSNRDHIHTAISSRGVAAVRPSGALCSPTS